MIWPAPQIGEQLATTSPSLIGTALYDLTTWTTRNVARIPDTIQTVAAPNEPHTYWQVGLMAGDEDAHATGFRTTIITVLPQQVSPDTTNYYWVGSYLSDGSFVQTGYYVAARDTSQAGWFYCAFYANAQQGPCQYGPLGSAGVNGARHVYALESSLGTGGDRWVWQARMDDTLLGTFTWATGESGAKTPVIYAESSGYKPHAATSVLGPVDFPVPLEVRHRGADKYVPATHLFAAYNAPNVCPPYGIATDTSGTGVLLGSGLSCPVGWSQVR